MNQKVAWIVFILAVVVGVWYFVRTSSKTEKSVEEKSSNVGSVENLIDGVYVLDTASSTITWTGSKTFIKGYADSGILSFTGGSVIVSEGAIVAGAFVIDMKSFSVIATGIGSENEKLVNHLKSSDFFNVAQYPVAVVGIHSIVNGAVTADVTIKDVTKQVVFPVIVSQVGEVLTADADLTIDRTLWDIKYGSSTLLGDLGDNVIGDTVTLNLSLVAHKMQ